jgi:hypothetical protein
MPHSLEIIIPALRDPAWLLESLTYSERPPDLVTIVSNEVPPPTGLPFPVRVLRFDSDYYGYGANDVVLRRNVGIWASASDNIVFQDDDQVAPTGMLAAAEQRLAFDTIFWGHHRFIDFETHGVRDLLAMAPEEGQTREHPPNALHGRWSSYAGMFGAHRAFLLALGGFDMMFLGRHGSEDQNLGYRALRARGQEKVFIWEPPFAWHPLTSPGWPVAPRTNLCAEHLLTKAPVINGVTFTACRNCPYQRADDDTDLFRVDLVLPFDPARVTVTEER